MKSIGMVKMKKDLPVLPNKSLLFIVISLVKKTSNMGIKKGKLPTSHCYDHLPLLRSRPGGFNRS